MKDSKKKMRDNFVIGEIVSGNICLCVCTCVAKPGLLGLERRQLKFSILQCETIRDSFCLSLVKNMQGKWRGSLHNLFHQIFMRPSVHQHWLGNLNTSSKKTCHILSRRPLNGKGDKIPKMILKNCIASGMLEIYRECCRYGGGSRKMPWKRFNWC